uniref:Peptidase S1 domain-containing protein n=1 Tax=Strigops habroptila TaxID=2489341 RepID=A0A672TYU2_STRHB
PEHHFLHLLLLLPVCLFRGCLAGHIVGGHEAQPHSHPYMAFLKVGTSFCGGCLVAPGWVMTAAHCMGQEREGTMGLEAHSLLIGASVLTVCPSRPAHEASLSSSVHNHPQTPSFLQLTAKATLNSYVKTTRLPKGSSNLPTGTKCGVAGWGLIDDEQVTNKLFEARVSIYSHRSCLSSLSLICPQGDSGGPLVCNEVAQGIVSFGYDTPAMVYTHICNYLPWIRKTMKQALCHLQQPQTFISSTAMGCSGHVGHRGLKQPALVEGVPARGRRLGLDEL